MSSSTYAGVMREMPIAAFPIGSGSMLRRGQICQWNSSTQVAEAWSAATNVPLGVCTGDADLVSLTVAVYVAKGCSILIKCDTGIIPQPNDFLFWSSTGVVSNTGVAGQQFARAIGVGMNGYVEAIIC